MLRRSSHSAFWFAASGALLTTALLAFGCSLRTIPPIVKITAQQFRDNPELAEMTQFAVVFSGGTTNSVSAADVGKRNLSCLKLTGQVSFPYTLTQLIQGVSIAVPLGSYTVRIIGYSGTTGSPTTIAQMFSGSSALKSFAIAESSLDTSATNTAQLNSTYVKATASDLVVACPTPQNELQTAYVVGDLGYLLSYSGSSWTATLSVDVATAIGAYAMNLGSQRIPLISFIDASSGGYLLRYAQKVSGTVTLETIRIPTENSANAIATDLGGTTFVLTRDDTPGDNQARLFRRAAGWIDEGIKLSQSTGIGSLRMAASPVDNSLLAISSSNLTAGPIHVEQRNAVGTWSTVGDWSSAGATGCTSATLRPEVSYDSLGYGHVIFECLGALQDYVGYLTNRSGAWQSYNLTPTGFAGQISHLAHSLDDNNQLHVLIAYQNSVRYLKGDPQTMTFNPVENVYTSGLSLGDLAIKAITGTQVRALMIEFSAGAYQLRPLDQEQGSWIRGSQISFHNTPMTLGLPIF